MLRATGWSGDRFPVARQEFAQLGLGRPWQAGEQVIKVCPAIDSPAFATNDNAVDHGTAPASVWMTNEKKILFPNSAGTNGILSQVIVDFHTPIPQVGLQCRPFVKHITDCLV